MKYWLLSLVVYYAVACSLDNDRQLHARTAVSTAVPIFDLGNSTEVDSLIRRWDTEVRPDGKGLPRGGAYPFEGKVIFQQKCAHCHGLEGKEGLDGALVSSRAFSWPYASTLYDYIQRAMPFDKPGSLEVQEVYALSAWILHQNDLIKDSFYLSQQTLPTVRMPALERFVPDDRVGGKEVK